MNTMVESEYMGLKESVLARVREQPGETPRELASYLEANRTSVTSALSRLNASNQVFAVAGEYYPIDELDELVESAYGLENSAPTTGWRRWWRVLRRLAGWPETYALAAVIGYGAGRWLV